VQPSSELRNSPKEIALFPSAKTFRPHTKMPFDNLAEGHLFEKWAIGFELLA
jgi:hypothetical protein